MQHCFDLVWCQVNWWYKIFLFCFRSWNTLQEKSSTKAKFVFLFDAIIYWCMGLHYHLVSWHLHFNVFTIQVISFFQGLHILIYYVSLCLQSKFLNVWLLNPSIIQDYSIWVGKSPSMRDSWGRFRNVRNSMDIFQCLMVWICLICMCRVWYSPKVSKACKMKKTVIF